MVMEVVEGCSVATMRGRGSRSGSNVGLCGSLSGVYQKEESAPECFIRVQEGFKLNVDLIQCIQSEFGM